MAEEFEAFIEALSANQFSRFLALVEAGRLSIGQPVTTAAQVSEFAAAMLTLALRREMLHG